MIKKRIISSFLATMLLVSMTIPSFGNEPMIAKAASVSEGIKESVDVGKKMEVIVKDKNTYTSADGQYVLKYVPYDDKAQDMSQSKSSSIMTQKAVTLNASSAGGSFLNDCSTNFAFLDLNTRTNASDLQTLYLHVLEQLEKCYSADYEYDVQAEDLGDGVPRYILGMASYTGLNISNEELLEVYMRVLVDHPLFFYASNEIVYDGVHLCIQVDEEFVKGSVRDNYISQVASLIKQIASAAGSAKGNYQICKTVHDSILKEAEYAYEADGVTPVDSIYSHNIIGLIKNGKVVCDGYAKTYAAVLNYLDISAIIVNGWGVPQGSVTTDDKAHAWNMVQLGDKEYYFADLTWDDTANSSYAFFCKGISLYDTHSLKPNSNSESYLLLYDELPEVPTQDYSGSNDSLYKEDDPVYKQNNSFTYSYNSTTKTLTFSGNGEITGFENCTKNAWYKYSKKAEKLVIKDGITGVGNFVFMDFTKLKSIDFPNQMSTLGQQAFCRCYSLKQVTLPDGINHYDSQVFAECKSLQTVTFGSQIGQGVAVWCTVNMFDECENLATIVVPQDNGTFEVKDGVLFAGNSLLCYPAARKASSYTIPEGTTELGRFAFSCCNNLKTIKMPQSLQKVDASFKFCKTLISLTFPASVQSFGNDNSPVDWGCDSLESIVNNSNTKLALNQGEQSLDGTTTAYWKNKATGKLVTSITKGTVMVVKYGFQKVTGQRFKVNGVTYEVLKEPIDLTLSQMNAQKAITTVKTIGYEPGFKLASKVQYNGWYYTVSKVAVIKPSECSTVKAALYGHDDVKVSWSKAKNAYGYKVYYKKSTSSKYTYAGKTTSHSMKISNLTDGKKYIFKVVPYITLNGKTYTKSPTKTTAIYTLKKVSTPRISKSSSKVKVSWTNISGETGYQISRSTKKTGTNIVATYKTTSGTSKTISATKGKTYYYKVRAYKEVGGQKIYGPWSSVKSYKRK